MIERQRGATPVSCAHRTSTAPILLLAAKAESARAAREFVREYMGHHAPDASEDYVGNVVLVACELVTNSIRYGTEPGDQLRLVLDVNDSCTRVEVHDPVRRHPRRSVPWALGRDRRRIRQGRIRGSDGIMTVPTISVPPGPGSVIGVAAVTGVHHTPAYALAQLLITHPGPRRDSETTEDVEDGNAAPRRRCTSAPATSNPHQPGFLDRAEHGGGKALRARTVDAITLAGYQIDMEFWPELDLADCSQCHANCSDSPNHP